MNKNGFTLVELIAVIVILGLLALIANSSVVNVVKNSKSDLYNSQLKLIESAAESWGNDNLDKLPNDGECKYLTLADLKKYGLMEKKIINPKNNREFSDDLYIKITSKINSSGVLKTMYKVDVNNISGCDKAYKPVCKAVTFETATKYSNDSTKTVGTIPSGDGTYKPGDEYICEVGPELTYRFYVLTTPKEGSSKVDLIMDQNINSDGSIPPKNESIYDSTELANPVYSMVDWINLNDYKLAGGLESSTTPSKGPITAMNFLEIATSSWTNLEKISVEKYESCDESGTCTMNDMRKYELYARLPYYSEVKVCSGINNCPLWLINHMEASADQQMLINGRTNAPSIWHYWTLSSDNYLSAWIVDYHSEVQQKEVYTASVAGVRPVISVLKANMD